MSTYTSAGPGAEPGDWRQSQSMGNGGYYWRGRGCGFGAGWHPFELLAMILGFIVFWPIGLGILVYKVWQRKTGYRRSFASAAWDTWAGMRQSGFAGGFGGGWATRRSGWRPGATWGLQGSGSTGNSAFDDWRTGELSRLEEERRKLEASEREFADYIANLRRAKDREEFERFMNARRAPTNPPAGGSGPEIL